MSKCSLTVALPVLSAMGLSCSVLPTAVLSSHTAFPDPHCRDLTADLSAIAAHWQQVGAEFDGIGVGYLSCPEQAEAVLQVLDSLHAPLTVIDPVMGDHGRLYSRITDAHVQAMRQLCCRADVVLPNLTEAAFLTGVPYHAQPSDAALDAMLEGLLALGAKSAVITGVGREPGKTGFAGLHRELGPFSYQAAQIPRQLHGTGDMFSAVMLGALTLGTALPDAGALAAGFVERVVRNTPEPTPFGARFEPVLPWLAGHSAQPEKASL